MTFNLADFLEATDPPAWLTYNSAWISHLPMAPVFIKLLQPRSFVELGAYRGDSYMAFCQAIDKLATATACTAIDTWEGDAHSSAYGPAVYLDLARNHDPRYGHFSRLLKSTFDDALSSFAPASIDLLHIDGFHTYDAVKHDFDTWLPKLSDRAVILFHDTAVRQRNFGVWKLWDEISPGHPHFNIPYGCGLGILALGPNVPPPFLTFLADLNAHHPRILPQFLALAHRNEQMRNCLILATSIHDCQSMANEWRRATGQSIANPTPNPKAAFDDPASFAKHTLHDVGQAVTDAVKLMTEVTQLRQAAKSTPCPA